MLWLKKKRKKIRNRYQARRYLFIFFRDNEYEEVLWKGTTYKFVKFLDGYYHLALSNHGKKEVFVVLLVGEYGDILDPAKLYSDMNGVLLGLEE